MTLSEGTVRQGGRTEDTVSEFGRNLIPRCVTDMEVWTATKSCVIVIVSLKVYNGEFVSS